MKKFSKGELVQIKSKYPDFGYGLIIHIECHASPGEDGWYSFIYYVLTSEGKISSMGESTIEKFD